MERNHEIPLSTRRFRSTMQNFIKNRAIIDEYDTQECDSKEKTFAAISLLGLLFSFFDQTGLDVELLKESVKIRLPNHSRLLESQSPSFQEFINRHWYDTVEVNGRYELSFKDNDGELLTAGRISFNDIICLIKECLFAILPLLENHWESSHEPSTCHLCIDRDLIKRTILKDASGFEKENVLKHPQLESCQNNGDTENKTNSETSKSSHGLDSAATDSLEAAVKALATGESSGGVGSSEPETKSASPVESKVVNPKFFKDTVLEDHEKLRTYVNEHVSDGQLVLAFACEDNGKETYKYEKCSSEEEARNKAYAYKNEENSKMKQQCPCVVFIGKAENQSRGQSSTSTATKKNCVKIVGSQPTPFANGLLRVQGCHEDKKMHFYIDSGADNGSVSIKHYDDYQKGIFTVCDINGDLTPMLIAQVSIEGLHDTDEFIPFHLLDVDTDDEEWNAIGMVHIKNVITVLLPKGIVPQKTPKSLKKLPQVLFYPKNKYKIEIYEQGLSINPI